jgi:gliding motility-associated-like protein
MKAPFFLLIILCCCFSSVSQTTTIRLGAENQTISCNNVIDVPIRASQFRKMLSMQGTVLWDHNVLQFDTISNYGASLLSLQASNFGNTQTANGKLFFSWNDQTLTGVSLPDASVLFTIRLKIKSTSPVLTRLHLGGDVVPLEFVDTSYLNLNVKPDTSLFNLQQKITDFNPLPDTIRQCGVSTTLNAGSGYNSYSWSNGATVASTLANASGSYSIVVRNSLGCIGQDQTFVNLIAADILQQDTTICKGTSLTVRARAGNGWTYLWSNNSTSASITITPGLTSMYRLSVSDGVITCRDSVNINVSSADTSLSTTGPASFCSNKDSVEMIAAVNAAYSWTRNGVTIPGAISRRYIASLTGNYRVIVRSNAGCIDSSRIVSLNVFPLPDARLRNTADSFICQNGSVLLVASGGNVYRWYRNDTLLSTPTSDSFNVTIPGRYYVDVVSTQGCIRRSDDTYSLKILFRPVLGLDARGICVDQQTLFENKTTNVPTFGASWRWNFGNGIQETSFNAQHVYRNPGPYRVTLTYQNSRCPTHIDSLSRNITILKIPNIRFRDVVVLKGNPLKVAVRDTAVSWLWTPSSGLSSAVIYNPIVTLQQNQSYMIRSTLKNGCIVMDTLLVKVTNETKIYVPKAFSPNGDGMNDNLFPLTVGIAELRFFRVYNRWGNLIYETKGLPISNGWDGRFKGVAQPMDQYVWVAEAVDVLGNILKDRGTSLLMR